VLFRSLLFPGQESAGPCDGTEAAEAAQWKKIEEVCEKISGDLAAE
jgi:hypothetical protein